MGSKKNDTIGAILQHFCVVKKNYALKTITQGYINSTYMVLDKEHPVYVLQRINQNVFGNVDSLMININNALAHLDDADYRKIDLIKTTDGKPYYEVKNGSWRLMSYINNSTTHNTTDSPKTAFEAGRIIGKFHQLMQNAHKDVYIDTIPDFHNLEFREKQFIDAQAAAASTKLVIAQEAIDYAENILAKMKVFNKTILPVRICHNDTKLNNILFSTATEKALCLIDLDTIMKGYFFYDFGDALRTLVNTAAEDEKELDRITFKRYLFEAFVDGIASNGAFLSEEEIKTLPLGAVFMPFIHGLRALTDFLNDNIYYKVSYDNQNLDRCLSLFAFTQKAWDEMEYMQEVVEEKLA